MELEAVLAAEMGRISVVVDAVAADLRRPRAWWVRALDVIQGILV